MQGKSELKTISLTIFPEFVDTKNTRKLKINLKEINIQLYLQTAIVLFHLGNGVER
jgi:hypothetical protein